MSEKQRPSQDTNPPYIETTSSWRRPAALLLGVAALGVGWGVFRAGGEAVEFIDEKQALVGLGLTGAGVLTLKNIERFRSPSKAKAIGMAGLLAGATLVVTDALDAAEDLGDSSTTTTIEQPEPPSSEFSAVDQQGNTLVITIPSLTGLACQDTPPHEVQPGDTTYDIIQGQQGYSDEQMNALLDAVPAIADQSTIQAGQQLDITCQT